MADEDIEAAEVVNDFRKERRRLAKDLVGGIFDAFSPHAFIDAFLALREEMRPPLPLGDQHDAQEALDIFFQHTPMCSALFDAGSGGHCPFFVNLTSSEETGSWFMNRMTEGGALINMSALLQDGFGRLVDKLKKVPPVLVAILPACAYLESDDEDWWLGNLVGAHWGRWRGRLVGRI